MGAFRFEMRVVTTSRVITRANESELSTLPAHSFSQGHRPLGYNHKRIEHNAKIYARGNIHTNTIEGFWSLVKRGIDGVHHMVGANYLQDYINAYAFRWNHRNDEKPMFLQILSRLASLRA